MTIRRGWLAQRTLALAALAVLGLTMGIGSAAADSRCHTYCSGPHQDYKSCMDRCIEHESQYDRHEARRSLRDLCSSRGQDEEQCLREHGGGGGGGRRFQEEPPRYDQRRGPPPCFYDQWGRYVCERN